ncbi:SDR family oxidoreductase [uncultured Microbulbifer sp.]|uniref:SDR family NAD(P)-dependent oxidoreductase n=1 Tax=uncultured Microbulbifer sp. TaxID=348147 RepID=UPI00261BB0FA|nr:SDR family oxidoreductase [uncultured Microbulbifer sp.]
MSRVVVVTGASKGIGACISKMFLECGDVVVGLSSSLKNIEALKMSDRVFESERFVGGECDVSSSGAIEELFEKIAHQYGHIDVLINNAGWVDPVGILEMELDNWDKTIAVNLTGVFLCTKSVVRYMRNMNGVILNIASTAGMSARPGWSAYAASKAAVINFSITMAEELEEYGIRVLALSPGRTATELRKKLAPDEDQSLILQPEQIANTVKFLCSEEGRFITGQNIEIRKR